MTPVNGTLVNGVMTSSTWVVSWVTATGNTVVGHSIADGVYQITLTYSDRATDTFYRLYGAAISPRTGVTNSDNTQFSHTLLLNETASSYLADFDYSGTGTVTNAANTQFSHRLLNTWSGFTATI